jgi:hypothetical protein
MAKRTGEWDTYKESVTHYKKEIRKAERSSWRGYCQKIDDVPDLRRSRQNRQLIW